MAYVGFWNNLGGTTRVDDRRRAFVRDDPGVRAVGIPGGERNRDGGAERKREERKKGEKKGKNFASLHRNFRAL